MKDKIKALFHLFLPIIGGSLIGFITNKSIDYSNLIKPPLAPPKILFTIAWSIIYLLLGISYYLYKKRNNDKTVDIVYYIGLIVNYLWTFIFFVFKLRLLAIFWIILLDILVILLAILYYKYEKKSALLLIPYILWIIFATYLTTGIYVLN